MLTEVMMVYFRLHLGDPIYKFSNKMFPLLKVKKQTALIIATNMNPLKTSEQTVVTRGLRSLKVFEPHKH